VLVHGAAEPENQTQNSKRMISQDPLLISQPPTPQQPNPTPQPQADLESLCTEKDAHAARLQEQAAAREAQLQLDSEARAQELYARLDALQAELDGVADYRDRQVEFEGVVASLREESQGLREALAAQKTELERYYAGQNAKMRKEYEQRLEELKHAQVRMMTGASNQAACKVAWGWFGLHSCMQYCGRWKGLQEGATSQRLTGQRKLNHYPTLL